MSTATDWSHFRRGDLFVPTKLAVVHFLDLMIDVASRV